MRQLVCENNSRWHAGRENQLSGTIFPVKAKGCLENFFKWNKLPWSVESLSENFNIFVLFNLVSTVSEKTTTQKTNIEFYRACAV